MPEYIDRDALLKGIDGVYDCSDMVFEDGKDHNCKPESCKGCRWLETLKWARGVIARAPAADAERVKHAKYRSTGYDELYCDFGACSCCGCEMPSGSKYCPNCGAKMDGEV